MLGRRQMLVTACMQVDCSAPSHPAIQMRPGELCCLPSAQCLPSKWRTHLCQCWPSEANTVGCCAHSSLGASNLGFSESTMSTTFAWRSATCSRCYLLPAWPFAAASAAGISACATWAGHNAVQWCLPVTQATPHPPDIAAAAEDAAETSVAALPWSSAGAQCPAGCLRSSAESDQCDSGYLSAVCPCVATGKQ